MKNIQNIGAVLSAMALILFTACAFLTDFELDQATFDSYAESQGWNSELFAENMSERVIGQSFGSPVAFSQAVCDALQDANRVHQANNDGKVIWTQGKEVAFQLEKRSGTGVVSENKGLLFLLTFGLGFIGGLMYIIPNVWLKGPPGIKNNHIYHRSSTNRGWPAITMFVWFISFYIFLYFFPHYIVGWTFLVDPFEALYSDGIASQWLLYGFMYTYIMLLMGIRMFVKYRHNKYETLRTVSVVFFQLVFAFLIVELLPVFNLPGIDFKNAWPLDYDFLFDWNVKDLLETESYGKFGLFVFVWGIALALIIVPVFTYIFGKRWYCSWVCGCGGLAETLGDPYRQHSDKSLFAWKVERWLIHGVLIFAVFMTIWTGLHSYYAISTDNPRAEFLGISAYTVRSIYGFLIGSIFAGVVGTGFYPIFGNRVWCRFGCPLAAYMGIIQRFKSRFRITTNGGQCISCGNCSTYCEQGIDVRWYAQRGQNIVRASCVGCGVCSAVCPRGVLKLENGPLEERVSDNPILIGNDGVKINSAVLEDSSSS